MKKITGPSTFTAHVIRLEDGMRFHALVIPNDIADMYEQAAVTRVIVSLNGVESRRAIQRKKDGRRILVVGQGMLKRAGAELDTPVDVVLRPDADPDDVEIGEEFAEVLAQDDAARARWESFTVGRQRSLAFYVTSAKRSDTRLKRALELAEKIRTHTLLGDG